ncbi:acyl-CoA desaturase [Oleiphilus sp. HI0071]|jgi:stearoyl-CoA desaturase (delta-9 desaturase)|nr:MULTISPECIES: fatty acid desaturase [unclassified Oleiphilus]KZY67248.1 acyl-CoA desaturase [Oleiphilus sp. HI0065]KZY78934.1 acyl-CoA desaturase [Oleiphilus sp. HI0071]KZY91876.1 acyl-CoA desaturase [Oleiphilus sp. HI0073]KZZ49827.1 acyl-CoA desaturase [Oleiphilus sp. HI0118]KZZ57937.1 acyl-CoA desaturase [Oleiphilus sp. HI0122]KZZ73892.1 acyl-CoA desaturase [Oleiphilus sp. HI0130]KZZ81770.1 acyl-CoA desaturase [Oleiphilus sp. HI0133]
MGSNKDSNQSSKPKILWVNVLFFLITGLFAVVVVPWYGIVEGYDLFQVVAALLCMGYCGMSITAGYHRLWSHPTYKTKNWIKVIYALGGAFAMQNSALHWSSDHRVHHRYVDQNDKDPYSAKRGFWYSHMGWMLRDYSGDRYNDYSNAPDLKRDPIVMWQHRHYLKLAIAMNFGIPFLIGVWHGDIIGTMLIVGFLRLVLSQQVTFFINSLAHYWGSQPYTDKNSARDNGIIAYLTYGEGYHNYHHCFQADYRNGIRWYQYDPTKWFIFSLSKIGLASNLKRCGQHKVEKARAEMALKHVQDKLRFHADAEEIRQKLEAQFNDFVEALNRATEARKEWLDAKKCKMREAYEKSEAMHRYKELKQAMQAQRDEWRMLVAQYA